MVADLQSQYIRMPLKSNCKNAVFLINANSFYLYYTRVKQLPKYFRADFVCYDKIIVELKAVSDFSEEHYLQVYNYLKASGYKLGLLVNFGKKSLEHKRIPCVTKWQ